MLKFQSLTFKLMAKFCSTLLYSNFHLSKGAQSHNRATLSQGPALLK